MIQFIVYSFIQILRDEFFGCCFFGCWLRFFTSKMTSTIVSSKVFPILELFYNLGDWCRKTLGDIPLDRHVPQFFVKTLPETNMMSAPETPRVGSDVSFLLGNLPTDRCELLRSQATKNHISPKVEIHKI